MAGRLLLPSPNNSGGWGQPRSTADGAGTGRHGQPQQRTALDQQAATVLERGALALLFGLSLLVWPDVTVPGLAVAFALYAVLAAAGMVGTGVTDETDPHQPRGAYLVAGFVTVLAGLMSLLWPQITGLAFAMLVGAWAIAVGLLEVTAALARLLDDPAELRQRRTRIGTWLLAVAGVASVVAGVVVLLRPDAGATAQATVLGVYALFSAAVLLAAGRCLRPAVAVDEVS